MPYQLPLLETCGRMCMFSKPTLCMLASHTLPAHVAFIMSTRILLQLKLPVCVHEELVKPVRATEGDKCLSLEALLLFLKYKIRITMEHLISLAASRTSLRVFNINLVVFSLFWN